MKITILSEIDYAGSGHKLCEALRRHTKHDVVIYTGLYPNRLNLPQSPITNRRQAQKRVDMSDIIHLKGDFPPKDGYLGLRIMHKPIVITVSGSHFRKKEDGGYGKYHILQYKDACVRTSFEPDLLYPEYNGTWTPHPIDSTSKPRLWNRSKPPLLMHMTTSRENKGTAFIEEVFKTLNKRNNLIIQIPQIMPMEQAIQARREATIYFDQFKVGWYGNSALEAMQYGIPVACWISDFAISRVHTEISTCPVISTIKEIDLWVAKIECLLGSDLDKLSKDTKRYCDEMHSYESVAKQWDKIYATV